MFKRDEAKPMAIPMYPSLVIDKDERGNDTRKKITASRPDIVFFLCLGTRF